MKAIPRTICVDFDGVLHEYPAGILSYGHAGGRPVPGALRGMWELLSTGYHVVVLTARPVAAAARWIRENLGKGLLGKITVTNRKPTALAYIDDRAIRFTNWNDVTKYFA